MTDQELLNKSFAHIFKQGKFCTEDFGRHCHSHQNLLSAFAIHLSPDEITNQINYNFIIEKIISSNKKLRWMNGHKDVLQAILDSPYHDIYEYHIDSFGNYTRKNYTFAELQIKEYIKIAKDLKLVPPPEAQNYALLS